MADSGYARDAPEERPAKRRRHEDATRSPDRAARAEGRRHDGGHQRRSRSPDRERHKPSRHRDDQRGGRHSTDAADSHRHDRHRRRRSHRTLPEPAAQLPYSARPLSKSELDVFRPLLARYLDVQKSKDMADMDEREVKGRWKSFVAKWNEGTLAQSWYDPELFEETKQNPQWVESSRRKPAAPTTEEVSPDSHRVNVSTGGNEGPDRERRDDDDESADEDDEGDNYGPVLPGALPPSDRQGSTRRGPGIPSLQDLDVQREMNEEDRADRIAQIRLERKADRTQQKARLDELVPRAEAGTRERALEKKKEVNEKMKGFREKSPGGAAEVNDGELMGGGDSFDELKRMKASAERRKTEKEIRREEIFRAKEAEREEKLKEYRDKEERAMVLLRELARQRFG